MLEEIEGSVAAEKYRDLKLLIDGVERMPKQIKDCKFNAPPFIPKELRKAKIPSNLFFSPFEFTMMTLVEYIKELKKLYEQFVPVDLKKQIDKGE